MRWPWSKRESDTAREEIDAQMAEHRNVISQVRQVLKTVNEDMGRTADLMEAYDRADRERRE